MSVFNLNTMIQLSVNIQNRRYRLSNFGQNGYDFDRDPNRTKNTTCLDSQKMLNDTSKCVQENNDIHN